jgi:hypothetical protein
MASGLPRVCGGGNKLLIKVNFLFGGQHYDRFRLFLEGCMRILQCNLGFCGTTQNLL